MGRFLFRYSLRSLMERLDLPSWPGDDVLFAYGSSRDLERDLAIAHALLEEDVDGGAHREAECFEKGIGLFFGFLVDAYGDRFFVLVHDSIIMYCD